MNWLALAKLWVAVRPIHKLKERRRRKRLERSSELIDTEEEESGMNADQIASIGRTLLKVLGGTIASAAVTHGVIDASEVDALTTAIITGGGALMTIAGIWLSHRKHKA